jgi:hypothetical protein
MRIEQSANKKTKKARAIELYENSHDLSLEKMVRVFMKELDLPSENSARTYISMSKKALAEKLNLPYRSRKIDARRTKKGQAMKLFNDNPHLNRKEMIQLFIDKLGMTHASAATHCSACAKEYQGKKHQAMA